jgi:hypothetical protein
VFYAAEEIILYGIVEEHSLLRGMSFIMDSFFSLICSAGFSKQAAEWQNESSEKRHGEVRCPKQWESCPQFGCT